MHTWPLHALLRVRSSAQFAMHSFELGRHARVFRGFMCSGRGPIVANAKT
jgi:hypothetical protein